MGNCACAKAALIFSALYMPAISAYPNDLEDCDSAVLETRIKGCTRIINSKQDDDFTLSKAYLNRGFGYLKKDRYSLAVNDLDRSLELNRKDARAYLFRGIAHVLMDNFGMALSDYNLAKTYMRSDDPLADDVNALIKTVEETKSVLRANRQKVYDKHFSKSDPQAAQTNQNNKIIKIVELNKYSFSVLIDLDSADETKFPELAKNICVERIITYPNLCVLGVWDDEDVLPVQLVPLSSKQKDAQLFSYELGGSLWNCNKFPNHSGNECFQR